MYNNATQRITQISLAILFTALAACGGGGSGGGGDNNPSSNNFSSQISSSASSSELSSESTSSSNSLSSEETSASSSSSSSSEASSSETSAISSVSSFESSESSSSSSSSSIQSSSSSFSSSSIQSSSSSVSSVEAAPGVTIMFPTPVSMTEQGSILVRGTARDIHSKITDLRVNGIRATTSDNFTNWRARVTLEPGINKLVVSTTNAAGQTVVNAAEVSVKKTVLAKSIKGLAVDSASNRAFFVDSTLKNIIAVDLTSGARSIFSYGPFVSPTSVAVDSVNNRVLVTDAGYQAPPITSFDLTTASRSVISDYTNMNFPTAVALDYTNNRALLAESQSVTTVDLSTGEKGVLANNSTLNTNHYIGGPEDIVLDEVRNRALVTDHYHLVAIDLLSGISTSLSGPNTPNSVPWSNLRGVALDAPRNRALVLSHDSLTGGAVISVDLISGQRTVLSNNTIPNGQNSLLLPYYIAMDEINNRALVTDAVNNAIIAVDLTNGQRTVLSDNNLPNGSMSSALVSPHSLVLDPVNQNLIINDGSRRTLFSVNLITGERTDIPRLNERHGSNGFDAMAVDADQNRVLIADDILEAIVAIDMTSGFRSILSYQYSDGDNAIKYPTGLALDLENNRILISDMIYGLHSADLTSGIVSPIPTTTNFSFYTKISYHSNRIFLIDGSKQTLFAINLHNRNVKEISTNSKPNASTPFYFPSGIALDINRNRALVVDMGDIISVNLSTGARNLISKNSNGNSYASSIAFDDAHNRAFILNDTERSAVVIDIVTGERAIISK